MTSPIQPPPPPTLAAETEAPLGLFFSLSKTPHMWIQNYQCNEGPF